MKTVKILINLFLLVLAVYFLPQLLADMLYRPIGKPVPDWKPAGLLIILIIAAWIFIKWDRWIIRNWTLRRDWEPVLLFIMGGICWLIIHIKSPDTTFDIHIHDTYFVIDREQIASICFYILGIFSLFYCLLQLVLKKEMNIVMSRIHFWTTFIALDILFGVIYWHMQTGYPRVYVETENGSFNNTLYFQRFILSVLLLFLTAQILFFCNVVYSLVRRNKPPAGR